jgi:hypothetical protein
MQEIIFEVDDAPKLEEYNFEFCPVGTNTN